MIYGIKEFQDMIDSSLFGDNPWEEKAIIFRERMRREIYRLKKNAKRKKS